jgi:hypothetical protein
VTRRRGLALALAVAVAGCGDDPWCGLEICDIRQASCQRMAGEAAACLRETQPANVSVRVIDRDQYIAEESAAPPTAEEETAFRRWNAGMALLRLGPPDLTLSRAIAIDADNVGAYYSRAGKTITVVDHGYPMESRGAVSLLVHEMVHALQDATVGLESLFTLHAPDRDRTMAVAAVIEGEASYLGDIASVSLFGSDPHDVPWSKVLSRWQERAHADALSSLTPARLAWAHFNYPFGTELVQGADAGGGRPAVDQLFAVPPESGRQVLAGHAAVEPDGGPWVEEVGTDALPPLQSQFVLQWGDRMGSWFAWLFFARNGLTQAAEAVERMRGDRLALYWDELGGQPLVMWRMRFASAEMTELLASEPWPPTFRIWRLDRDLLLLGAADQALLDALAAALPFSGAAPSPSIARRPLPVIDASRIACAGLRDR